MHEVEEIGSEFDLFPGSLSLPVSFNLADFLGLEQDRFILVKGGRTALQYYLRYLAPVPKGSFLLPAYLCQAILDPFEFEGAKYIFYRVKENLEVDLADLRSKMNSETRGILIIHYFGFSQSQEVMDFLKKQKNCGVEIIEDLTQSFFSQGGSIGTVGDYALASFRKFIPIPDGGILYSSRKKIPKFKLSHGYDEYFAKRIIGQLWKHRYLQRGEVGSKKFLTFFRQGEKFYDSCREIKAMTEFSQLLLSRIKVESIVAARRNNFLALLKGLGSLKGLKPLYNQLPPGVCPLGFPILVKNGRDNLREFLTNQEIFCPVHWPLPEVVDPALFGEEHRLANRMLTLPCDQRYNNLHMNKIIKTIKVVYD